MAVGTRAMLGVFINQGAGRHMQAVYEPNNIIDAHLIKGLLESEGIQVYLRGEHLLGGMGELPAIGLLAIMVDEADWARARAIVKDWEMASFEIDSPPDEGWIEA